MISVREDVFETNSSSVHSLTLVSKPRYDAWKKGDAILVGEGNLIPFTELYDTIKKTIENRIARYEKELTEEKDEKSKSYKTEWLAEAKEDLAKVTSVDKDQFLNLSKQIILEDASGRFNEHYYDDHYYVGDDGKAPEYSEDVENWEAKKPIADILINYESDGYITEDKYYDNDWYETFQQTQNIDGVDVVAFGYYGHD